MSKRITSYKFDKELIYIEIINRKKIMFVNCIQIGRKTVFQNSTLKKNNFYLIRALSYLNAETILYPDLQTDKTKQAIFQLSK
ncbi:hypothetical protein, partial [Dysgonomonas sp. HGC4]|uniref:hypothetical protein n=1 Tax=Dysgonomonas sp. HGC4 TaxID=1658009 RepID=UPI000B2ED3C1